MKNLGLKRQTSTQHPSRHPVPGPPISCRPSLQLHCWVTVRSRRRCSTRHPAPYFAAPPSDPCGLLFVRDQHRATTSEWCSTHIITDGVHVGAPALPQVVLRSHHQLTFNLSLLAPLAFFRYKHVGCNIKQYWPWQLICTSSGRRRYERFRFDRGGCRDNEQCNEFRRDSKHYFMCMSQPQRDKAVVAQLEACIFFRVRTSN